MGLPSLREQVTTGDGLQLSRAVAITATLEEQVAISFVQVITGGMVSRTVICWAQEERFPQASVAWYVRVRVITQPLV